MKLTKQLRIAMTLAALCVVGIVGILVYYANYAKGATL